MAILQSEAVQEQEPTAITNTPALDGWWLALAALVATLFVGGIAATAITTGLLCVLFPEMGALAQDVFTRPSGKWSNAPIHLVLTPSIAAVLGLLTAQHFPYGYLSVFLAVGSAIAVLKILRSSIAPSISAALLPVVFEERSWWYPLAVFLGAASLALLSTLWKRSPGVACRILPPERKFEAFGKSQDHAGAGYFGLVALGVFLVLSVLLVKLTGLRLLLFPPLAVIAYEMFSRPKTCLWADRPLLVPLACFLTATGGFCAFKFLGVSVIAAAASMAWGFAVLYVLRIHLPPAMAVALIPLIAKHPTIIFPVSVAAGTLLLTMCYLGYCWIVANHLTLPVKSYSD
jgi:hypothetical protein